jgi:hypothetical protein
MRGKVKHELNDESAHNSLLEMAVSIVGKVIFDHQLDALVQLLPCGVEELLRRGIPSLHNGANIVLLDDEWDIVG